MKNRIHNFLSALRKEPVLLTIILLAFLLRVVGVGYGLPLTVVADETPFTLAALQMIQLHTLVPAFHPDAFVNILPYPPYLSYVLIPPFIAILGVKYLLWHGSMALFQAHLLTDLSAFFITARLFSVFLGVFSVYLVYRIAQMWFRSRIAAAAAGFLLATSLLHIALSMVGRNWMPTSVIFLLILFVLTHDAWSLKRRYTIGLVIAGLCMGITSLSVLSVALMALYYVCFDARSFEDLVRDGRRLIPAVLLFVVLAAIPAILWHSGNAFLGDVTLFQQKTLADFLLSPWNALSLMIFSEPILVASFLGGLVLIIAQRRWTGLFLTGWFLVYIATFYALYRFDPRFLTPLIPFFALAGGYCVARLWDRRTQAILCILLAIPLVASMRLDQLALQGDTREQARLWALEHLKQGDKVLVYASAFHLTTTAQAVAEMRAIDQSALRKIDTADEQLNRSDVPYALNNLLSVTDPQFFRDLPQYAAKHHYDYLILEPGLIGVSTTTEAAFTALTKNAPISAHFDGFGDQMSLSTSAFTRPLAQLFADKTLGPAIVIYQINHD